MGKIKYPLGILITMVIGTAANIIFCCNFWGDPKEDLKNSIVKIYDDENFDLSSNEFRLKDQNDNTIAVSSENFNFNLGEAKYIQPLSDSLIMSLDKIKLYLNFYPKHKIKITGLYASTEVNKSIFSNLGEARAYQVKSYMNTLGLNPTSILIKSKQVDSLEVIKNIVYGPIRYTVIEVDKQVNNESSLQEMEQSINENPLVLYFNSENEDLIFTQKEKEKVSTLIEYLNLNTNATLHVIGYANNAENAMNDRTIGLKHADIAKQYLISNGIPNTRIIVEGKDAVDFIANDKETYGKTMNQSVVITVK